MPWQGSAPNQTYVRSDGTRTGSAVNVTADGAGVNNTAALADNRENDFATALNLVLKRDGGNQPSADLPMNTHKLTGMSQGSARTDSIRLDQVQDGDLIYAEAAGTANAIELTTSPTCAPVEGMMIVFVAEADSTSAVTIDLNGDGAAALQVGGGACAGGEINNGQAHIIVFDGTQWQLVNPFFADGFVLTAMIADLAVTTGKINDLAVTEGKIAADAVATAKIADEAVTNAKLAHMAQSTLKGRAASAGTGDATDLTAAQVLTLLAAFSTMNIQTFTASGTYTPTSGMKYCIVFTTGGGGGGGGAETTDTSAGGGGGGGGAGGTAIELFTAAQVGASQSVAIGAGGTAGSSSGGNGGTGGNSSFGSLHTANGGVGAIGVSTAEAPRIIGGADGGTASDGLINLRGGSGNTGISGNDDACGGTGGASFWGGGARGGRIISGATTAAGTAGSTYGEGGGGAASVDVVSGAAGGAGAGGVCVVIEFI